jgi:hypothetical protein
VYRIRWQFPGQLRSVPIGPFPGAECLTEKSGTADKSPMPFDTFKALTGKLVRVPKKEVDAKEAAYQRNRPARHCSAMNVSRVPTVFGTGV